MSHQHILRTYNKLVKISFTDTLEIIRSYKLRKWQTYHNDTQNNSLKRLKNTNLPQYKRIINSLWRRN